MEIRAVLPAFMVKSNIGYCFKFTETARLNMIMIVQIQPHLSSGFLLMTLIRVLRNEML